MASPCHCELIYCVIETFFFSIGYHALGHRHDMPEEEASMSPTPSGKRAFDMPELLHNLDLLCDMTEEEIIRNNKKWAALKK